MRARYSAFVTGAIDFIVASTHTHSRNEIDLSFIREWSETSTWHGLEILDGPYSDIANSDGFATECAQGRDLGFDGKTLIHPNQIEACNAAFSPAPDEVAQARKMIAAFDLPENKAKGVVQIDGRMIERMHAEMARRTVAIADAIAARG